MSIAVAPAQRWPRFLHAPGFAEFARNGPKSRPSPVPVIKIPPLRGLERDRAGSLPVHGTVSAGPDTIPAAFIEDPVRRTDIPRATWTTGRYFRRSNGLSRRDGCVLGKTG